MEGGVIQIDRLLGEGGMGAVYLAHDETGDPLALKVLKSQASEVQEMFEQEVGILSKLKHPGLVEIRGFSKSGEGVVGLPSPAKATEDQPSEALAKQACFWMEYVEGQPLLAAAKGNPTATVLQWFEESLEALEYLHSQGILHGDLKPANVLISEQGHVKVVDFGLAALTQNLKGKTGKTKGSIPYMAPESLDGERLPASDLFALGTVFYEVLAGKHPRAGARNLKSLFTPEVPKLSDKNPQVPTRTARVIERLLVPDLGARLQSARETQEALHQEEVAPGDKVDFYSFKMLGIEKSWNQFFTFKKEVQRQGQRGLVLVHGLTGVGKARFLREIFFELALEGDRVLQGPEHGAGGFLAQDFFQAGAPGKDGDFFLQILPAAEDFAPPQLKELYRFLRQPEGTPGILLLEFNDEGLDEFHRDFFSSLAKETGVLDLPLQNLSYENTERFLQDCLRRSLPEPIVRDLFDRTQGNPKLLTETGRELLQSGLLKKKNLTLELFQSLALPKSAQEIFARRLAQLSPTDEAILKPIALGLGRVRPKALMALTGLALEQLRPGLSRLMQMGLIRSNAETEGESYRLSHSNLLPLLEEQTGTEEIQGLHRQWLTYLEKTLPAGGESQLEWMAPLALHALAVPGAENRVKWINRAATLYTAQENHEKARRLYAQCLAEKMPAEDREPMVRAYINTYGRMGRFKDSLEKLEEWFREFGDAPGGINRVKYFLSSGVSHQNEGNLKEARRRLSQCIQSADLKNTEQRPLVTRAYSLLGLIDLQEGALAQAKENFAQALAHLPAESIQAAEVFKHQALAAAKEEDWETGLEFLQQADALYRRLNHPIGIFSVALERGNIALSLGRLEDSRLAYVEARNIAQQNKDDAGLARVEQNLGVLDCRRGLFQRAIQDLEKAREIFAFLGSPSDRGVNMMQLALAHASVGHFAKGDELLEFPRGLPIPHEEFSRRLQEVEFIIETIRWGRIPRDRKNPFLDKLSERPQEWDMERRLLQLMLQDAEGHDRSEAIQEILRTIHHALPGSLKIGFEERGDWRRFILKEEVRPEVNPISAQPFSMGGDDMDILEKVAEITKALLSTTNFDKLLVGLMDAAMELSKAKNGFLILRSDPSFAKATEGLSSEALAKEEPIPGYSIKVARNLNKEDIGKENFKVSVSALKEAVDKGKMLVTDNALTDNRFAEAKSVHQMELKSILALPLKTPEGVLGALYLDHPYKTDIFQEPELKVLNILADQAALAVQKAQMIAKLQSSNVELSDTVKGQASEISLLKREVQENRVQLKHEYKDIIGRSPPMLEVLSMVDRVTETLVPVWIYGESGTGKEMIARSLHFNSSRAKHPFVSENCSALPETLLESELFGHKKGAFTHADRDKKGLLEHADGGTVFLDEIADMSLTMQAKLLRFLQEGEIRPIGSNEILHVDVRVVSASNKNLQKLVAEGKFREDLYYRLVGVTITLPPLRDRLDDIPLLAQHFLKKIAKEENKEVMEISADALETLMDYPWPGNVRELENTLRTATLFPQKGKVTAKSLHFKKQLTEAEVAPPLRAKAPAGPAETARTAATPTTVPTPGLSEEKRLLLKALFDTGYHKGHAAKALGISRRYLYTQLLRHQVPVNRIEMKAYIEETLRPH